MMRLARDQKKSVREIEEWDSSEISEWMAYDRIEPMEDTWHQTGILAALMHNLWSSSKSQPKSPVDFIPVKRAPRKPKSPRELRAMMAAHASALSGGK